MILLKYVFKKYEAQPTKNEDSVKIIMVKNHLDATTFNWTTVELRRRLTNFKMLVSQSVWAVLRQSV